MKKRLLALSMIAMMACNIAACSPVEKNEATQTADSEASTVAEAAADEEVYNIGVLQLVQHPALDLSNKGFFAALDDAGVKYNVDDQNAGGEQSACQTIADKFVNDKKDLILAIATPAAQAVAGATSDIPIVVTAVTDPMASGLVESNDKPGVNVTGSSDLTPVKEQIELLKKLLPNAKKVGILFSSAEANSQIQADMAKEACENNGLEAIFFTVSSSNEIQTVVESMSGKVDAIYAPTDNMISSAMATVSMAATDIKLPIICGEVAQVEAGSLATYGVDYYELGYMAGEQAVSILRDGKNPADIPIAYLSAEKCEFAVNEEVADILGIDVSSIK